MSNDDSSLTAHEIRSTPSQDVFVGSSGNDVHSSNEIVSKNEKIAVSNSDSNEIRSSLSQTKDMDQELNNENGPYVRRTPNKNTISKFFNNTPKSKTPIEKKDRIINITTQVDDVQYTADYSNDTAEYNPRKELASNISQFTHPDKNINGDSTFPEKSFHDSFIESRSSPKSIVDGDITNETQFTDNDVEHNIIYSNDTDPFTPIQTQAIGSSGRVLVNNETIIISQENGKDNSKSSSDNVNSNGILNNDTLNSSPTRSKFTNTDDLNNIIEETSLENGGNDTTLGPDRQVIANSSINYSIQLKDPNSVDDKVNNTPELSTPTFEKHRPSDPQYINNPDNEYISGNMDTQFDSLPFETSNNRVSQYQERQNLSETQMILATSQSQGIPTISQTPGTSTISQTQLISQLSQTQLVPNRDTQTQIVQDNISQTQLIQNIQTVSENSSGVFNSTPKNTNKLSRIVEVNTNDDNISVAIDIAELSDEVKSFSVEPIIEVPVTSPFAADGRNNKKSSSPTKLPDTSCLTPVKTIMNNDTRIVEILNTEEDVGSVSTSPSSGLTTNGSRIRLQMSTMYGNISSSPSLSESQNTERSNLNNEFDATQELPEIDDEAVETSTKQLQENETTGDSQQIVMNRRQMKKEQRESIDTNDDNEEYETVIPSKKSQKSSNDIIDRVSLSRLASFDDKIEYKTPTKKRRKIESSIKDENLLKVNEEKIIPQDILLKEGGSLTDKDVIFEDSVWCLYGVNMRYYPGRILDDSGTEEAKVLFALEEQYTKYSDIFLLDIRIGDIVQWQLHSYQVVGLEARNKENSSVCIRCIRGYDTVYLNKQQQQQESTITKTTKIVPLSDIHITMDEWSKRSKIFQTKEVEKSPIRGRTNTTLNSPKYIKEKVYGLRNANKMKYEEKEEEEETRIDILKSVSIGKEQGSVNNNNTVISTTIPKDLTISSNAKCKKIFKDCLFVISGINDGRDELLKKYINMMDGEIIIGGVQSIFKYSKKIGSTLRSKFIEYSLDLQILDKYGTKRFICLISHKHLRSIKYMEMLALRWPTIHWKYIIDNVEKDYNEIDINKLNKYLLPSGGSNRLIDNDGNIVIKSNNIIKFLINFDNGKLLNEQLYGMNELMLNFIVIIQGESSINEFVKFLFACLGVKILYYSKMNDDDLIMLKIRELINKCCNDGKRLLVYLNNDKQINNTLIEEFHDKIKEIENEYEFKVNIESKEWLLQTIINEDTGFY